MFIGLYITTDPRLSGKVNPGSWNNKDPVLKFVDALYATSVPFVVE